MSLLITTPASATNIGVTYIPSPHPNLSKSSPYAFRSRNPPSSAALPTGYNTISFSRSRFLQFSLPSSPLQNMCLCLQLEKGSASVRLELGSNQNSSWAREQFSSCSFSTRTRSRTREAKLGSSSYKLEFVFHMSSSSEQSSARFASFTGLRSDQGSREVGRLFGALRVARVHMVHALLIKAVARRHLGLENFI